MKDIILQILLRAFLLIAVKEYLTLFFQKKRLYWSTLLPWLFLFSWQILVRVQDWNSPWLNFYVQFFLIFLLSIFSYSGNLQIKLFSTCLFNCFWLLGDLLWREFISEIQFYTPNTLALGYLLIGFLLLAFLFFFRNPIKQISRFFIQPGQQILLFLIPTGTVIILNYLSFYTYIKNTFLLYLFFISLNILVFYLYYELAKGYETEKKVLKYQEQLKLCSHYTETQMKLMDHFHKERHDLKHLFLYLNQLVDEENYSMLHTILTDKITSLGFTATSPSFYTQNLAVDALLKHYSRLAEQYSLDFQLDLNFSPELPVDSYDFILLLGNALDNSFEAQFLLKEKRPFIHVGIKEQKGLLVIQTENPYEGSLQCLESGQYLSSKKQPGHGYGLALLKQVAEKYNGTIYINTDSQIFRLEIILYLS